MGIESEYSLIMLMPNQIVYKDPDGLVDYDRITLQEYFKPKTISLIFDIIKE